MRRVDAALIDDAMLEAAILALLANRSPTASCCPSEVARALAPDAETRWRALMPRIRDVVAILVASGQVIATRGEKTLSTDEFAGGPIRIRRGPRY